MPVNVTPEYMKAARRFFDNHPDAEARMHRAHLGGLGISEEDQQEIVNQNAAHIAHDPAAVSAIGSQPKSHHEQAAARVRAGESKGPEADREPTNEDTDGYRALRIKAILSGERKASRRETTRLLMMKKNR